MSQAVLSALLVLVLGALDAGVTPAAARTQNCPPASMLSPCTCVSYINQISCWSIKEHFDLKGIFTNLTAFLEQPIVFDEFKLVDSTLTTIPANVFDTARFKKISLIKNRHLSHIASAAFDSTYNHTESVSISENPALRNEPNEHQIFNVLSKFVNAKEIWLNDNNISTIPKNAFKPLRGVQRNLTWLSFIDNNIADIGNRAFYELPNLRYLLLDGNFVRKIRSSAFEFRRQRAPEPLPRETLKVYLRENYLTSESFEVGALGKFRRKVFIDLSRNNITHLPRAIFGPLFAANNESAVVLRHNPLRCDCRFGWLMASNLLYNSTDPTREFQVRGVYCNGSQSLKMSELHPADFVHCSPDDLSPFVPDDSFDDEMSDGLSGDVGSGVSRLNPVFELGFLLFFAASVTRWKSV